MKSLNEIRDENALNYAKEIEFSGYDSTEERNGLNLVALDMSRGYQRGAQEMRDSIVEWLKRENHPAQMSPPWTWAELIEKRFK
jgi:hypothetical protein